MQKRGKFHKKLKNIFLGRGFWREWERGRGGEWESGRMGEGSGRGRGNWISEL